MGRTVARPEPKRERETSPVSLFRFSWSLVFDIDFLRFPPYSYSRALLLRLNLASLYILSSTVLCHLLVVSRVLGRMNLLTYHSSYMEHGAWWLVPRRLLSVCISRREGFVCQLRFL